MIKHPRGRDEADVDMLGPTTKLISHLSSQTCVHESLYRLRLDWLGTRLCLPNSAGHVGLWVSTNMVSTACFHGSHIFGPMTPRRIPSSIPSLGIRCGLGLCGRNLSPGLDTESLIAAMGGKGQQTAKDCGSIDITQSVFFPTEKFLFYLKPLPIFLIHHTSKKLVNLH